jgi:hypothetical protein
MNRLIHEAPSGERYRSRAAERFRYAVSEPLADRAGNIAYRLIGRVPRRYGDEEVSFFRASGDRQRAWGEFVLSSRFRRLPILRKDLS